MTLTFLEGNKGVATMQGLVCRVCVHSPGLLACGAELSRVVLMGEAACCGSACFGSAHR